MTWFAEDYWIVAAGALAAAPCALVGCWLVLNKLSMMGDAISHAVLPGLAVGFLVTGARHSVPMFVGAAVVGVLTAVFTRWIHRFGRVDQNASMGVVFTTLFAVGLLLIVQAADHVDLDPGCVLYGAIELTPLDTIGVFGLEVPRAVLVLGAIYLVDLLVVLACYKELTLAAFDSAHATALGFDADGLLYLLMGLVAVTTVAAFEAVGSIVVIAMLIVPAATARVLTDRLWPMLWLAQGAGVLAAALGHYGAVAGPRLLGHPHSTSTAGMMAVAAGALFAGAVVLGPRHGVLAQLARRARLRLQILAEDVVGVLYRLEELAPERSATGWPARELAPLLMTSRVSVWLASRQLCGQGKLRRLDGGLTLTDAGREDGARLVRSHRLWELFLADHLGLPPDHVHATADRLEHLRVLDQALDDDMGDLALDPHGKPIPAAGAGTGEHRVAGTGPSD